jgi:hypothetical protein
MAPHHFNWQGQARRFCSIIINKRQTLCKREFSVVGAENLQPLRQRQNFPAFLCAALSMRGWTSCRRQFPNTRVEDVNTGKLVKVGEGTIQLFGKMIKNVYIGTWCKSLQ